jgi:hypothetical protein
MKDDLQTKRVYRSENKVFSDEEKMSELMIKLYFNKVTRSSWFRAKYGDGYSLYFCGDYLYDYSYAGYKEVYLLKNEHFTKSSVLHELAHAVKRLRSKPHGISFCKRYLELINIYIGKEKFLELKKTFLKNKVNF